MPRHRPSVAPVAGLGHIPLVLDRGFETLLPEATAVELLLSTLQSVEEREELPLELADGRVVAVPARAAADVPYFDRAAMDGFAVSAEDTASATPAGPVRLRLAEVIERMAAVPVHTGSPLPPGCDAVLPVEDAVRDGSFVEALRRVRSGEHVGRRGEDVEAGEVVIQSGHLLRPPDLGLLRALGVERVEVIRRPRVRIVSTGEELVAAGSRPDGGRMIDTNGIMLAASARRWGAETEDQPCYSDDPAEIARMLGRGSVDLVVTSGGTSVGERDQVVEALSREGEVTFHGVAIQPARPVAAGRVGGIPVLCLPGFPAATFISAFVFLRPAVCRLARRPLPRPRIVRGTLTRKIVSTLGLRSYTRVSVAGERVTPVRTSGAGILSSIVRADGFVVTPEHSEGVAEGAEVEVLLFDG